METIKKIGAGIIKTRKKRKLSLTDHPRDKKFKKQKKTKKEAYHFVVPWANFNEWESICSLFNTIDSEEGDGDSQEIRQKIISEILIWKERVPSLPIGIESALFLLQAQSYDMDLKGSKSDNYNEEQSRSLYSIAIIRFLNHVSHLASKELSEDFPEQAALPMFKLVSHINIPDWIVDLRHLVSHGTTLPTLESLRISAQFIQIWLKENYFSTKDEFESRPQNILTQNINDEKVEEEEEEKINDFSYEKGCQILSSYLASKIYLKQKGHKTITDQEIIQVCSEISSSSMTFNNTEMLKTKQVLKILKSKIYNFIITGGQLFCLAIAIEFIPDKKFYQDFSFLFQEKEDNEFIFEQFYQLWTPIVTILEEKDKILEVCIELVNIYVHNETSIFSQEFCIRWLNKLLDTFENTIKKNTQTNGKKLNLIMSALLKGLKPSSKDLIKRIIPLLESHIGSKKHFKLKNLFKIWFTNDEDITKSINGSKKEQRIIKNNKLFELKDINSNRAEKSNDSLNGLEEEQIEWAKIPFGACFKML